MSSGISNISKINYGNNKSKRKVKKKKKKKTRDMFKNINEGLNQPPM